jgi:hypothetical protein
MVILFLPRDTKLFGVLLPVVQFAFCVLFGFYKYDFETIHTISVHHKYMSWSADARM